MLLFIPLYAENIFLAGNENGLFEIEYLKPRKIWSDAQVFKISKAGNQWLFLTDKGLAASKDLKQFYYLNDNLPRKIIKTIGQDGN